MEYWIDGYNLINRQRWTDSMTLEQARDRLLSALVPLKLTVRVYFDASKPGAPVGVGSGNTPDSRVRAVFVRDRSADDAMVEDLRRTKAGTVTLVTDDRELRGRAKQLGAVTAGVEKFLERLKIANAPRSTPAPESRAGFSKGLAARRGPAGSASPPPERSDKPSGMSKKELDELLDIFSRPLDDAPDDGS